MSLVIWDGIREHTSAYVSIRQHILNSYTMRLVIWDGLLIWHLNVKQSGCESCRRMLTYADVC